MGVTLMCSKLQNAQSSFRMHLCDKRIPHSLDFHFHSDEDSPILYHSHMKSKSSRSKEISLFLYFSKPNNLKVDFKEIHNSFPLHRTNAPIVDRVIRLEVFVVGSGCVDLETKAPNWVMQAK